MSVLALLALLASPSLLLSGQPEYELKAGKWREQNVIDPDTPEGQLQVIRKAISENRAKRAEKLASQWIEQHPDHPQLVEAYLVHGDALVVQRHYFKSLFDYEYIVRVFPASTQYYTALEREYKIAKLFAGGMKRIWLGLRILPAADEAEELLIRIQERSPGSEVAERASIALGEYYFGRAAMSNAAEAFELFIVNYPNSRYRERALLRVIQSNLATFKGPRFDATGLIEAAQRLRDFEVEFPASAQRLGADALQVRIEESLALKDFYAGRWYERGSQRISAIYMYRRVIEDRPHTVAAQAALERLTALGEPFADEAASPSHTDEPENEPNEAVDRG